MAKEPGIVRYNRIRHELSELRKKEGIDFHGSFNDWSKDLFRKTRKEPLDQVENNLDVFIENIARSRFEGKKGERYRGLQEEFFEGAYYFDFANDFPTGARAPKNVIINSPSVMGRSVLTNEYDYERDLKKFVTWVDANRNAEMESPSFMWSGKDYGPRLKLVQREGDNFDLKNMAYKFDLVMVDEEGRELDGEGKPITYGYDPLKEVDYIPPDKWKMPAPGGLPEEEIPEEEEPGKPGKKAPVKERELSLQYRIAREERLKQEAVERSLDKKLKLIEKLESLGFSKEEIRKQLSE